MGKRYNFLYHILAISFVFAKFVAIINLLITMLSDFEFLLPPEDEDSPYLDKSGFIKTWWNNLPHWEQLNKVQFITFRLADSLPQSKLREIDALRNNFVRRYPKPWDAPTERLYRTLVSRRQEALLDNGYGCCAMRNPVYRKIMTDALEFYDGDKYDLLGYVVMPNHVHCLVKMNGEHEADGVFKSIKRFSAREINKLAGSDCVSWSESWDRLVRDYSHLKRCLGYIYDNPRYLPASDYSLGGRMILAGNF